VAHSKGTKELLTSFTLHQVRQRYFDADADVICSTTIHGYPDRDDAARCIYPYDREVRALRVCNTMLRILFRYKTIFGQRFHARIRPNQMREVELDVRSSFR
jgi:hypothetical protein